MLSGSKTGGDRKLSRDVLWTMGSFGVLTLSGIAINLIVVTLRDATALGVFNLAYAVYIVASQLAVCGIHYSVLRASAHLSEDKPERRRMLATATAFALVAGLIVAGAVYLGRPLFLRVFGSESGAMAISYAGLGLALFPLNKVLIAHINGLRHMRAFSLLQAARYVLVMLWVAWISGSDLPFEWSGLAFLVAEGVTTIAGVTYLAWLRELSWLVPSEDWMKAHFTFGVKSLPSGALLELNTRVDVLVIGIFLGDRQVGIYSFAALIVDGLYHVLAMLRVNVSPLLVIASREGNWTEARRLQGIARRYLIPVMFALSVISVAAYSALIEWVLPSKDLAGGIVPLAVLLLGLSLISALVPFDNVLMASGYPGMQALQSLAVASSNALLNVLLVPYMGILGAAIGTATSFVLGAVVLMAFVRRLLGWDLLTNRVSASP